MLRDVDVVIVGAGLAGLVAGRSLVQAGFEPLIVEARDRVGGRVLDEPIGAGKVVEMGAEFTGSTKPILNALAGEFGIGSFPTYSTGQHTLELEDLIQRYEGTRLPLSPSGMLDFFRGSKTLDRMAARVPLSAPYRADDAVEWDNQNLAGWMDTVMHNHQAKTMLGLAIRSVWAGEPEEVNLLQALALIKSMGTFEALISTTKGGWLQDRFVGGAQQIATEIAHQLGDRILLNHPAQTIRQTTTGVEITAANTVVRGRRAIIAVPPPLAARIEFDPPLPPARHQALTNLPLGSTTKIIAVFDEPFWRHDGLSGRSATDNGPIVSTFDTSPPDGSPGVLTGFIVGKRARDFATIPPPQRRELTLNTLTRLFGPRARHPEQYLEKDWRADPWSAGCFFGLARRGHITGPIRNLAKPIGALHWAGSETIWESFGGMDGAVRSGQRAAREIRQQLRPADAESEPLQPARTS